MKVAELFSLQSKVAAVVGGTGVLGATFCHGLAGASWRRSESRPSGALICVDGGFSAVTI